MLCVTATLFWSTVAIFIRYLNDNYQLPSLVLAFWRDFFVASTLIVVFSLFNRSRLSLGQKNLRFVIIYGFVLSLFNATWTLSVQLNGAAVSTVLAYSSPAFTAIIARWLFRERLDKVKWVVVALNLFGTVLISGALDLAAWRLNPLGIITGLLSGVAFAAYSLMGKAASERGINPWTVLLYTFLSASGFLLIYNLISSGTMGVNPVSQLFWLGSHYSGWLVLLLLAMIPSIGGYGLYSVSLGYLPASVANLIATLEPPLTAVMAYVLLGERFTLPQIIGGAVIIVSVTILRLVEGRNGRALALEVN